MSFNFLVELTDLILQIIDLQLIKHDNLMIPMLTQKTFKANRAEAILAKCLNVFISMYLTLRQILVAIRYNFSLMLLLLHHLLLLGNTKLHIMSVVSVLTSSHILGISLNAYLIYGCSAIDAASSSPTSSTSTRNTSTSRRSLSTSGPHHIILSIANRTPNLIIIVALHFGKLFRFYLINHT